MWRGGRGRGGVWVRGSAIPVVPFAVVFFCFSLLTLVPMFRFCGPHPFFSPVYLCFRCFCCPTGTGCWCARNKCAARARGENLRESPAVASCDDLIGRDDLISSFLLTVNEASWLLYFCIFLVFFFFFFPSVFPPCLPVCRSKHSVVRPLTSRIVV